MMSKISSAEEEYIKVVSFLQGKNGRARTTDVANKLGKSLIQNMRLSKISYSL